MCGGAVAAAERGLGGVFGARDGRAEGGLSDTTAGLKTGDTMALLSPVLRFGKIGLGLHES